MASILEERMNFIQDGFTSYLRVNSQRYLYKSHIFVPYSLQLPIILVLNELTSQILSVWPFKVNICLMS